MKYIIDTATSTIIGPLESLNKSATTKSQTFSELLANAGTYGKFETGLLPVMHSGLLSYRTSHGYEQLIIQLGPEISTVKWGYRENDKDARLYSIAMPYRIVIADFENNNFIGARHFFALAPALDWNTQLYATGFCNTNNLGYNETSIGWICLYHNKAGNNIVDLSHKIDYVVNRESGLGEPYNYVNMSRTDAPIFFKSRMPNRDHFHSAENWQKHTKKHKDYQWVLDPENNVPLYTNVSDNFYAQKYTDPKHKDSVAYTLYLASHNNYAPYYRRTEVKPINKPDAKMDMAGIVNMLSAARNVSYIPQGELPKVKAPTVSDKAAAKKKILDSKLCPMCAKSYPPTHAFYPAITEFDDDFNIVKYSEVCETCITKKTTRKTVNKKNLYVSLNLCYLMIDPTSDKEAWYLNYEMTECNFCEARFPKDHEASFLVYHLTLNETSGCIYCIDKLNIIEDFITKKKVYKTAITEINLLQFSLSNSGKPELVLAPAKVHTSHFDHVCNCGMYIEDLDELTPVQKENKKVLVCKTCTQNNLIELTDIIMVPVQLKENK